MSKLEQVLQIEPQNELRFKGPFNVPVTSYMKLTNPTDKKVMFKIKTTAPKKYCVRPNSGVLEPNTTIDIAICLQPFIFDPAEKNKHKFMVQTVFAPDGDVNLDLLWKDISPDQLMDSKLKCVFEIPPDQNASYDEPPKVANKPPPPQNNANANATIDTELQKAALEVQQLREEESNLRQENLRLREEILRLKHTAGAQQPQVMRKYTPPPQPTISVLYMAVGVALALIGVIVGKFVL